MEIYVLDRNIDIVGILGSYEGLIWNTMYNEPGTFKIEFLFDPEVNEWMKRGNLLYKNDEEEVGVITRRFIKINKYGEESLLVSGYMLSRYLNMRIIWDKMTLSGKPELVMRDLVYQQCIGCSAERKIPRLQLGSLKGYGGTAISKQITYDNLQEALTDVSKMSELGYRILLDLKDKALYFDVYKGRDRTYGTSEACVFNREYGNIIEQEYEESEDYYRNVCLIAGSGKDDARIRTTVGNASGLDRYELYCNAAWMSDKELSQAEYIRQLQTKGQEKLNGFPITRSFISKADSESDAGIGDYVTCVDQRWGIMMDTQIRGIEKCYCRKEISKVYTFGDSQPTLVQLIKTNIRE